MSLIPIESDFGRGVASYFEPSQIDINKPQATFLSANGHAVTTYDFFTNELSKRFNLHAIENRGVWPSTTPNSPKTNWSDFLDDYFYFLESRHLTDGNLLHIGHSLGASLGMMAALKRPELFKQLVMIEPGTSPSYGTHAIYRMLPQKQRYRFKFINSTSKRRNSWASEEEFMRDMRTKTVYKNFSDVAMQSYAKGGLVQKEGSSNAEFTLKFPPAWEAHIFTDVRYVFPMIKKLKVPTLLIRAANSHLCSEKLFQHYKELYRRKNPLITTAIIENAGHLVVQENHQKVLQVIDEWSASTPSK